ncbi:MAG: Holliday junction branch migration protein RuvA [Eubacteriales bacterium]|nr:Holliday junction branch migration protein RuvA [Eubacteriales bacterium]
MISFVRGKAVDMTESSLIVESFGLGFEIFMTGSALSRIHLGDEVLIHTYFQVREDAMQLFGFLGKDDLSMFRLLLGVNGVGPKAALGILSGLTADELRFAILSDDVRTLSRAPGIGKKTAQKLILELKDKLDLGEAFAMKAANVQAAQLHQEEGLTDAKQEAVEALVALGYSSTDALRAVRRAAEGETQDTESILKGALKHL